MIKEQQLTEQEELREKLIGKIEVLDKVKELLLQSRKRKPTPLGVG
ncbi:hypothetical protein [Clostridium botulinum]|nr:hypothetical protein [Clostridium botulinum]